MLEGAAVLVAAFVAFALASFVIDRTLRLETGYRLVLLLMLVVGMGRLIHLRLMKPLEVDLSDEEMALAVERADPGVRQALISALQFEDSLHAGRPIVESREMMTAVVDDVEQRAATMDISGAVDERRVRRYTAILAGAAIVGLGWTAMQPATVALWAKRNLLLSSVEWPRYTLLDFTDVEGGAIRVPEGEDITLLVRANGVVPDQAYLHYEFGGGETGAEPMTLTGENEFAFTLQSVLDDATVYATGGDGISPELRIEVVERPQLQDLAVTLIYPEYMKLEDRVLGATEGDVRMPRGGHLRLSARSTKPLQSASLTFGQDQRVPMEIADGERISGAFTPQETGLLTINVVDRDRLDSAQPPQLYLRLGEDREPAIDFQTSGIGAMVTPIARIPGTLKVRDDYGLREVAAQYRVMGTPEGEAPAENPAPATDDDEWSAAEIPALDSFVPDTASEYEEQVALDLRPMHPGGDPASPESPLRAGQQIALRFTALDNFGPGDPHEGVGDAFVFRVVTREKLMEDLSRRQLEQRRELELILRAERASLAELSEIVSPTSEDPRAGQAKLRVLALAREQRALGRRVEGIGISYRQILDEFLNNRIFEPGDVTELRGTIVTPLESLAAEDFPDSASAVREFADSGKQDVRMVVVASYEAIIQRLEQVLAQMNEAENFATILQGLRETIKLQTSAIRATEKRQGEEAGGLFNPREEPKEKKNEGKNPKEPK